jgi:hypothetical protein
MTCPMNAYPMKIMAKITKKWVRSAVARARVCVITPSLGWKSISFKIRPRSNMMFIPLKVMYSCKYSTRLFISRNIAPISTIWFGTFKLVTNAEASRFL